MSDTRRDFVSNIPPGRSVAPYKSTYRNKSSGNLYIQNKFPFGNLWELVDSGCSGTSSLSRDVYSSIDIGGYSVGDILPLGLSFTDFVEGLVSPLQLPTKLNNSLTINGLSSGIYEVGYSFTSNISTVYNRGIIYSKNNSPDVFLTGAELSVLYSGPGINPLSGIINSIISEGTNIWSAVLNFDVESSLYYDSQGNQSNIFDSLRGPNTISKNTNSIIGLFKYWVSVGSIETTSSAVRLLSQSGFFPVLVFNIIIPANTLDVAFYIPNTYNTVKVLYIESSNADVTSSFTEVNMNVNDAGGNSKSYSRFETTIGGVGYPSTATYKVILT